MELQKNNPPLNRSFPIENNTNLHRINPQIKSSNEIKTGVLHELKRTDIKTFNERSQSIWKKITQNNSCIKEKIDVFSKKHKEKIELIKSKSWNQLKQELNIEMARKKDPESMEEFRELANALVNEIVSEACKDLGLPEVGWTSCGTAGFNSDVDTAMYSKGGLKLTQEEAYTIKFLRDTAHCFVFGGLSGIQLDTESYTPHPALNDTAKLLAFSETQQQFTTTEYAMVLMQAKRGFQGDEKKWNEFCNRELNSILDPNQRETVSKILKEIENWDESMERDVLKEILKNFQHNHSEEFPLEIDQMSLDEIKTHSNSIMQQDPFAYKRASLNCRVPLMMRIAEKTGNLESKMQGLEKKLHQSNHSSEGEISNMALTLEIDKLLIEIDILSKLLNCLQDEGTFSQSEGNVTLFREKGQIDAGNMAKSPKKFKQEVSLLEANLENPPSPSDLSYTREQIVEKREKRAPPTAKELTLASMEEQQQFNHILSDGLSRAANQATSSLSNREAGTAVINAGKYCLRTMQNKIRAMEKVKEEFNQEQKPLPESFLILFEEMKRAEYTALQLEQCKRKFRLNQESSTSLLAKAILSTAKHTSSSINKKDLERDLSSIIRKLNPGEDLSEETLLKREKMNKILDDLDQRGYIDEISTTPPVQAAVIAQKQIPKNERIHRILEAAIGYSRVKEKHNSLNELFKDADTITLLRLNLSTKEQVFEFGNYIQSLTHSWQNMAFELGVLEPLADSEWVQSNMKFEVIWENAKNETHLNPLSP